MLVHCFLVSFLSLLRFEMKKNSLQSFKDGRNENYRKTKKQETRNEENKKKMLEHQQEERERSIEDMLPTKKLNCFQ